MMMPELPHRKAARVFRHWPTGHDDARSKTAFAPLLAYQGTPAHWYPTDRNVPVDAILHPSV